MPEYKLTYFNARGRAELTRLIFHASGTKFIDNRIEGAQWPALKPKIPLGFLPALEIDGKIYGQSTAIARYVARKTGLSGKTLEEEFRADELVDTVSDVAQKFIKIKFEKDEAKKAELQKTFQSDDIPKYLDTLSKFLKQNGGNFFVGKSLTWADLSIYTSFDLALTDEEAKKRADLAAFKKRIEDIPKIAAYLKARPKTDF